MPSELGLDLRALRKKNRDLLQQLETNSALLEQRLIKLRQEARTPRRSDKYLRRVPPPNFKEESWNTKNDLEKFQSRPKYNSFCDNSGEGSINENLNLLKDNSRQISVTESLTPQSKRPRPFLVTSSYKKKRKFHRKRNNKSSRQLLKPNYTKYRRKIKPCLECYCSGQSISEESEISDDSNIETVYKHYHPKKLSKNIKVGLPTVQQVPHDDFEFNCLKHTDNLIDYTPESIFLRRLKQRSQNLNDINPNKKFMQSVNDGVKMCNCSSQLNRKCSDTSKCIGSPDTNVCQGMKYPKCNSSKQTCSCHMDNSSKLTCSCHTIQPLSCCCTSEATSRAKDTHTEVTHKIDICGCCTNENTNYEIRLPHTEKLGSRCICLNSKEKHNEKSHYQLQTHCCKQSSKNKFKGSDGVFEKERINDLIEFRRSHWNDCHSHSTDGQSKSSGTGGNHECIHHFTLNQRLIPEPIYQDSYGGSCCAECLVPEKSLELNLSQCSRKADSTTKSSRELKSNQSISGCRNITLPIKGDALKIVTVPAKLLQDKEKSVNRSEKHKTSGKVQPCPLTHGASKVFKAGRAPAPTNSYALRYQKGVC